MKAVRVSQERGVEVIEVREPEARANFAVVKVMASSISGAERRYYDGTAPDPWVGLRDNFGHEAAGVVCKVSSSRLVKVGDRVALFGAYRHCGRCRYCLTGRWLFCQDDSEPPQVAGYHSQYVLIRDDFCLPVPDDVDFDAASLLAAPFGAAFRAIKRLRVTAQDRVLVMGQGPLGLAATLLCKFLGARVKAVDTNEYRLACAQRCGADEISNPESLEPRALPLGLPGAKDIEVAIDCTGSQEGRLGCLETVGRSGRVAFVGVNGGLHLEPAQAGQIFLKEIELIGSWYSNPSDVLELAELVNRGLDPTRIVTHRFGIDEASEAFATGFGGAAGTVVILPWGG
jgi:2-desacetyl-2-hydroxyethyl bacteriochlorophyllide A dehydrogenase